jgi:DnaJ-class molecular chaperone
MHFANNGSFSNFQGPKKLFKIFPVISYINNSFQETYLPNRDNSIDESTLWKVHLSFKQYLPQKASNLGIKTYDPCDATNGYLWPFFVYVGTGR